MRLEPPEAVSEEKIKIDIHEIEAILQGPAMKLKPWPEAMAKLKDGRVLYIREARPEDVPLMLGYMKRIMEVDHDYYDIVGARVYGEILGWHRKRLKDPFQLLGLIDGQWAGFANGRFWDENIAISLHTMTFARGGRLGWIMYYAKTYYALEVMGVQEWWSTFESNNGWKMAGVEMAQPRKSWPEHQHELGGAMIYYVNQKYWTKVLRNYLQSALGTELVFNVPADIKKANETFRVPDEVTV
jgi:hypothetical protein